ncbi:MAG: hypothetical protein LBT56_03910 [Prevotellaceae bacterium]|jgi:DNA-binding PadR family transcriptional regulator|nr:hypothetical protein [Prevotellaceae bacterium]
MNVPVQTADIFKILSKGQFISSNSSNRIISDLYNVIDSEDNFENLREYFKQINFILERGEEYFYFTRNEAKIDIENKIERAYKWIDITDFLKTFDNSFGLGFRFSPSEILVKLKLDAELETKLESLNKNKEPQQDALERILKTLADDSFIELENERTGQYKVLAAFKYIEQLILTINISEEVQNEIPE